MKSLLLSAALAMMAGSTAYAQNPAPTEPHAAAPANQAAPATPDLKAPAQTVPATQMNSTADNAPRPPTFVPDQSWVGRYVYSNDNKDLGKIASVKRTGASSDIYFDMGGFLGLGATRKSVVAEQVRDVQSDRIILSLTKAQAENLPEQK
jgi:hypothetical protein